MYYRRRDSIKIIIIAVLFVCFIIFCLLYHPVKASIRELSKSNEFRLEISDPIIVAQQSDTDENSWGYFQFPRMCYTENGNILMQIANKKDSMATYSGEYLYYISENQGETWRVCDENDSLADYSLLMENGCYYQGPVLLDTIQTDAFDNMTPYFTSEDKKGKHELYKAGEISLNIGYTATEYDPVLCEEKSFETSYLWEERPLVLTNGLLVPNNKWLYSYKMHTPNCIIKEKRGVCSLLYMEEAEKEQISHI